MWVSMAEASAAPPIDEHDGHNVYSSGGACLRHARPHHLCCPLYVVSSAVALPKRLHRLWVTGRLWTNALSRQIGKHSRGDLLPLPAGNGLSSPWWGSAMAGITWQLHSPTKSIHEGLICMVLIARAATTSRLIARLRNVVTPLVGVRGGASGAGTRIIHRP